MPITIPLISADGATSTVTLPDPAVGTSGGTASWRAVKLGAGGWLRGMDVQFDGVKSEKVARTDTYGSYIWDPPVPSLGNAGGLGSWRQLFTVASLPANDPITQDDVRDAMGSNYGTYELKIAPSSTSVLWALHWGAVFTTQNRGVKWARTAFTPIPDCQANTGENGGIGPKIAIDPQNPNICFVGTKSNGLFVTRDGGATFALVAGVPASTGAGIGIVFDPTSAVIGGAKQGVYAMRDGVGVYHSTDGGKTWAQLAGAPVNYVHMRCDQAGKLWVADGTTALHRYAAGAWFTCPLSINTPVCDVAIDPANANRIIACDLGGQLAQSLDGGNTWAVAGQNVNNRTATDVPWLGWTWETWMSVGEIHFDPDPKRPNTLCFAEGIGYWEQNPSPTNPISAGKWTSFNSGIEQLVINTVKTPPGGKPIIAMWDRTVMFVQDPNVYPLKHGVNENPQAQNSAIGYGYDCDYASSDPTFSVGWTGGGGLFGSGYSTDSVSWKFFAAQPNSGYGGCIAAASPKNIVVAGFMQGKPQVTQDGGASWNPCNIAGLAAFDRVYWDHMQILAADRVNIGTFYLYDFQTGNIFKSVAGGASGSWTSITPPFVVQGYLPVMQAVPGHGGHVIWTAGAPFYAGAVPQHILYRTQDGGKTWADVSNAAYTVRGVWCFGFGAVKAWQSYPRVGIYGTVNGVIGVWETSDNFATWRQLCDKRFNGLTMDQVVSMDGGPKDGSWIVGLHGSGCIAYGL